MSPLSQNLLLIVDDDPAWIITVSEVATRLSYSVITADSASAFRQAVMQFKPAVVLLDLQMKGVDGVAGLRYLASIGLPTEVMLVSSLDARVLSTAKQFGGSLGLKMLKALQKPIAMSDLENCLASRSSDASVITVAELQKAIEEYELLLHYQPILHRSHGGWQAGAVEALVRWQHPTRGLLYPAQFLPLAEQSKLSAKLTDFVLTESLRQVGHWRTQGLELNLAVNLPAHTVGDLDFPDRLSKVLREHGVDASALCFEVTEATAVGEIETVMDSFARLRVRGVGLALDDFGVGTSSLTQLYKMPYSMLKIDSSLIAEMAHAPEANTIVEAIIELGHKLSLTVCAEGVEDALTFDVLDHAGCDQIQGQHISKPVPASALETFLLAWGNAA